MRRRAGGRIIDTMRVFLLGLVLAGVFVSPAWAAQVAYIDGDQVWVSTLDGSQKRSLSGPSPDEKQWREVGQADDGTVIGVRREGSMMGQFNATRLWGPDGSVIGEGRLTAKPGRTSYAFPVTLDLTPDGVTAVYGYANWTGFGTGTTYEFGTYAEVSKDWSSEPFDVRTVASGTLVGRRIVGISGSTVHLQNDVGQPPYSEDFAPWFDVSGLGGSIGHVDVAANGRMAAVEAGATGAQKIALIPFDSLGGPPPSDGRDCFLPGVGDVEDLSFSQDGTSMAWEDDRGVVVAGTPVWFPSAAVSTCNLSRPPVVISATGSDPSIGGSTAATPAQATPAGPPPSGAGAAPPSGTTGPVRTTRGPLVTLAKTLRARALRGGIPLTVTVRGAGRVTVTGRVAGKLVAKGTVRARRAGKVRLRLKATKAALRRLSRLRGKTLVVKVTASGRSTTLRRRLR
jgi:hypothetical protein